MGPAARNLWAEWQAARLAVLLLALGLAGCADTDQERVRLLNEDGLHQFQSGQYVGAQQNFEAALKLKGDDPSLVFNLAQCHDRQGNDRKAEELYRSCLASAPNHAPCHHALTVFLLRTGRRTEADQMVEDWLAREPKLADAYIEDAWRLRQGGDLLSAQGRLQQALDLDPKNPRALVEMGVLYELMERQDRALDLYERALQYNPRQPDVVERVNLLRSRGVAKPLPD
jgi:Tfp pilus assembly protein PilF